MDSEPIKLSTPLTNSEKDTFNEITSFENEIETSESEKQIELFSTMEAEEIVVYIANTEVLSYRLVIRAIHFCNEVARKAAWAKDEALMNEYTLAVQSLEAIRRGIV
jgi:glycyl-tRNA synthetase alpha subunit